jgi:hypothetical protein
MRQGFVYVQLEKYEFKKLNCLYEKEKNINVS